MRINDIQKMAKYYRFFLQYKVITGKPPHVHVSASYNIVWL